MIPSEVRFQSNIETPFLPEMWSAFCKWTQDNNEQAKKVEIPNEYLSVLIPEQAYKAADDPNQIEAISFNPKETAVIIVEHNSSRQLTDPAAWEEWIAKRARARPKELAQLLRGYPGVDRLHGNFVKDIKDGRLKLSDRVLLSANLMPANDQLLFVRNYDGEVGEGIATSFYRDTLPKVARQLGFRFIGGQNDKENKAFFVEKLDRKSYLEIKPEYRKLLFPYMHEEYAGTVDTDTVQFLYPEDENEYLLPVS